MGLLDGLVGGAVGAEMITLVNGFVEKQGGVQGIMTQFQKQGLGDTVQSWIGTGPNQPVTGQQVHAALGADTIKEMAQKFGISPDAVSSKLAEILPQAVDKMTPNGKIAA